MVINHGEFDTDFASWSPFGINSIILSSRTTPTFKVGQFEERNLNFWSRFAYLRIGKQKKKAGKEKERMPSFLMKMPVKLIKKTWAGLDSFCEPVRKTANRTVRNSLLLLLPSPRLRRYEGNVYFISSCDQL